MKTLERRLVDTLRDEAERLPDEEAAYTLPPMEPKRPGFLRPGLAAPAAVVAVMILAAPVIWLSAGRGGGEAPATSPSTQPARTDTTRPVVTATPANPLRFGGLLGSVMDLLPDGFDPESASPLLVMDASPEEAAMRYLETRNLTTDVGISRVEEQDGYTLVRWAWGRLLDELELEQGESGWLLMVSTSRGFEVLAAITEDVDLSDINVTDGQLRGTVRSGTDQQMGVDVLNMDATPVASAPNPEGMPDADFRWGTAGAGTPPLRLDLRVTEPVILRVNLVGGALLSISEVIFGQSSDIPAGGRVVQEGNLDTPPFSGDGWQLIVGEGPNPPTDTYKVCHSFAPASGPNEANGFGPSGCVTWPDDATDTIIMDAIPFTTPDGQILLFVDLTADSFDTVSVVLDDGSTRDVAPFAMPQSGKQFAVVELPADTNTIEIQLLDEDTMVESRTIDIEPIE